MSLANLRDRLVVEGCNKHDQVVALIISCINDGIDEGAAILRTIVELGYHPKHVGSQLDLHRGPSPDRHLWFKAENGNYCLHP